MIEGRDYQEAFARKQLTREWAAGRRAVLGVAPVGAGKTRIAAMICSDRVARGTADFWMLAHRKELIEQPYNLLTSFGIQATKVLAGGNPNPRSSVHVASVDTLYNRVITPCLSKCVLIIDEAHRAVGDRYMEMIKRFRAAYGADNVYMLLLTATPYRLDGRSMGNVADALVEITTPQELFARGLLMEPTIIGLEPPNLEGVGRRGGDFIKEAVAERVNTKKLVGNVVDSWIRYSQGAPSVYFACNIAHSLHLTERFLAAGVRAAHLDGTTPPGIRSRLLARLAIGGRGSNHPEALDVICNVDVLREGWDSESDYQRVVNDPTLWLADGSLPPYVPLEVLGDCDPTESCCAYRQREGRVCRSHPDKRRAILISHSGNYQRHGLLRDHFGFNLDENVGEKLARKARVAAFVAKHCSQCLAVWPPGTEICSCGAPLAKPVELPSESKDELAPVVNAPKVLPPDPALERKYLRALWAKWKRDNVIRRANGQEPVKEGRVAYIFKNKFGHWAPRELLLTTKREVMGG